MRPLHAILLFFTVAQPSVAWLLQYFATKTVLPLLSGGSTTSLAPLITTAPLTISPTSTSTSYSTDYVFGNGYGGGGFNEARINVTVELLVLPNVTNLPVSDFHIWDPPVETATASPTIESYYYAPVTLSNPASCTQTTFTYTDSVAISLPDTYVAQATATSIATYVTTYVSTISTNLGGQAVTTSRCDVYFNSEAIPSAEILDADHYLTECVDPRRSTCSAGENQEATGSGGCRGVYPPTRAAVSDPTSTSADGSSAQPTKSGGAASFKGSVGSLSCLVSVWGLYLIL
ncbi:hypothetical protein BGW36DRAFT_435343 [Talaromyces proteolyticus]|uniref:Uncharacterized protein n=1 Tax=Talaromyces proteolyticus TaxID=1131652 RepID=A0AAD4L0V0_9EURO|nr:uncharacterized protein BGW36DRAFT_435343 [Talaromyces proteolyticus]KAH8705482.1 hypothetical protein BGW36DRAFT_435343 [Talaromyces proteolyticus]